ncbi:MAG: glutamate--tRNA ligase [Thaumarchaeota archaeon]|nr:glutamate--tRNA ligase [Nitrososphaerota archaeon]
MDDELNSIIRKLALQNAFEHGGNTRDKIILSKLLGIRPELRGSMKEVAPQVSDIVTSINAMSITEQEAEIAKCFPDVLIPKEKTVKQDAFPELTDAKHGMVVTRFPPEPNGYPHIGHAKAAIINTEYAKMYGGKCILRMDDTNPEAERMEYHAAIKVGLEWLGIKFEEIKNTSDDMELFYEKGLELVQSRNAYVCTCKKETISKNRRERKACKCSMADIDKNIKGWEKMFEKFKPGEAVIRFRGDISSDNAVMRDPVLFRIIDEKHYTLGEKYRVWPSYDFAVAIEDSTDGVTHAFRSKEFELREELTISILDKLDMRKPNQGFFSRLEFKGMPISKRILKPLIDEGKVSWYDDPRLPTLEALKRRGIKPEAIKKFIISLGMTKANTLAPFDALEAFNRGMVDGSSIRLFMVREPKKITIKNIPFTSVDVPNHPIENMGSREIDVDGNFLIDGADAVKLVSGSRVRFMGLGDVLITSAESNIEGEFVKGEASGLQKIHWVPEKTSHKIMIQIPGPLFVDEQFNEDSLEEVKAFVEPHYMQLNDGDEIQFVRFGYCKKDSQNQVIFTHR